MEEFPSLSKGGGGGEVKSIKRQSKRASFGKNHLTSSTSTNAMSDNNNNNSSNAASNTSSFLSSEEILAEIERQKKKKAQGGRKSVSEPPSATEPIERGRGKLLRQGYLIKQGVTNRTWRKRWFVLTDAASVREFPTLTYYQTRPTASVKLVPINVISLVQGAVIQTHEDCFELDTPTRTYFLRAASDEECASWVHALATILPPPMSAETENDDAASEIVGVSLKNDSDTLATSKSTNSSHPNHSHKDVEAEGKKVADQENTPPSTTSHNLFHLNIPKIPSSKLAPLSTPFSTVPILEGYLVKEGNRIKTKKRRWFVLRGQVLVYYTDHRRLEPLGVIYLRNCTSIVRLDRVDKHGHLFELTTPGRVFPLAAETAEEVNSWVDCISRVVNSIATQAAFEVDTNSLECPEDIPNGQETAAEGGGGGGEGDKEEDEDDGGEDEEIFEMEDPFGDGAKVFSSSIEAPEPEPPAPEKSNAKPIPVLVSTLPPFDSRSVLTKSPIPLALPFSDDSENSKALRHSWSNPSLNSSAGSASSSTTSLTGKRPSSLLSDSSTGAIDVLNDLMGSLNDLDAFISQESMNSQTKSKSKPLVNTSNDDVDDILNALDDLKQSI